MLTNDEIRALNEARTILDRVQADCGKHRRDAPDNYTEPDGWEYGRVCEIAHQADWMIFSVLNTISSCRVQLIPDQLMHNREDDPLRNPGLAEVEIESEEDGFHLVVNAEHGRYTFGIHDGAQLLQAVKPVQAHWDEGRRAAAEHQRQIDDGGYALDDPKSEGYHERVSDLSDRRKP